MGVTIHYRGKLKSPSLIEPLMQEVADICQSKNWKYNLFNGKKDFDELLKSPEEADEWEEANPDEQAIKASIDTDIDLRGISFHPHPESESVILTFNNEGELKSLIAMLLLPEYTNMHGLLFTKTQFAGIETHVEIIHLLIYLKKKYFKNLKIIDEGGYYPKKNIEMLTERLGVINFAISTIQDIFENTEFNGSPDDMIEKVQEALSRSIKGAEVKIIRIEDFDGTNDEDINQKDLMDDDVF